MKAAQAKAEAENQRQEELSELSEMIEEQGKNARFKPRVMTYNDMTNTPEPLQQKKIEPEEPEEEEYEEFEEPEIPEAEFEDAETEEEFEDVEVLNEEEESDESHR